MAVKKNLRYCRRSRLCGTLHVDGQDSRHGHDVLEKTSAGFLSTEIRQPSQKKTLPAFTVLVDARGHDSTLTVRNGVKSKSFDLLPFKNDRTCFVFETFLPSICVS